MMPWCLGGGEVLWSPSKEGGLLFWEMRFLSQIPSSGQLSSHPDPGEVGGGACAALDILGQWAANSNSPVPPPHPRACESLSPPHAPCSQVWPSKLARPGTSSQEPRTSARAAGTQTGEWTQRSRQM